MSHNSLTSNVHVIFVQYSTVHVHCTLTSQGSDTSLVCLGAGPADSITWEKVGSDLGSSTITVTRNVLTITAASVTDRGLYVCNVENSCGAQGRASSLLEVSKIFLTKYFVEIFSLPGRAERASHSVAVPLHSADSHAGRECSLPVSLHVR